MYITTWLYGYIQCKRMGGLSAPRYAPRNPLRLAGSPDRPRRESRDLASGAGLLVQAPEGRRRVERRERLRLFHERDEGPEGREDSRDCVAGIGLRQRAEDRDPLRLRESREVERDRGGRLAGLRGLRGLRGDRGDRGDRGEGFRHFVSPGPAAFPARDPFDLPKIP